MKTRKEVAEYINSGKCVKDAETNKGAMWHFGLLELRALMDFIYEGKPEDNELITKID